MTPRLRSQLLNHLFKIAIIENEGHDVLQFVKTDFLVSSLSAIKTLFTHGKHNLIYGLSKCFEGEVPRMALNQMPFGLLDYNIRFFAKGNTQMLGIEEDYVSWLVTMFSHFGHKWLCLHRGPAWQYEVEADNSLSVAEESGEEGPGDQGPGEEGPAEVGPGEERPHEEGPAKEGPGEEGPAEEVDIIQRALQESSFCLTDAEWAGETLDNVDPQQWTTRKYFTYPICGPMLVQANKWTWKLGYCPHNIWNKFMAYSQLVTALGDILECTIH